MSNYDNLIALPYIDGRQDCYSIVRDYYSQVWDLELPNFARPSMFWTDRTMDLYSLYRLTGFQPVIDDHNYEIGDALIMPLASAINSHAAVVVDDNQILHHLPNQISSIDPLRPKWANRVTIHLRHPEITKKKQDSVEVVHLHEVIDADILRDPRLQAEIERAMAAERGRLRSDHTVDGNSGETQPIS